MDESKPQPDQDVVELVKRVQGGDTDAYTELFNSFHGPVLGYVYHMLHDRQAAEDVAQEAFIRAHDRIDQLGPPFNFKSWVFRIASNLAIDYTRAGKRFVDVEDQVMPYLDDEPSTQRPYEKRLQRKQQRDAVWRSLNQLPEHYRQALILREFNELEYREVAQTLEVTYDNARQIVHRARNKFRDEHGLRLTVEGGGKRCDELGDLLSAYRDDELDPLQAQEVREHLETCADCQREREEQEKVGALLAGLPPLVPSAGWKELVLRQIKNKHMSSKAPATVRAEQVGPEGAGADSAGPTPKPPAAGSGGGAAAAATGGGGGTWSALMGIWPWLLGIPLLGALVLGGGLVFAGGLGALGAATSTPAEAASETPGESPTAVAGASLDSTPTRTPTPSPSPTLTLTPTITPTPTLGPAMATALENSNCRAGPSDQFGVVGYLLQGDSAPIDGRSEDDTYWWIERADGSGHCYVWQGLVETSGDVESVPYVDDPPTPTPADQGPPSVSVSHSPSGQGEPDPGDQVTIQAQASDDIGVERIEIWVNGPSDNQAQLVNACSQQTSCSAQVGPYSSGTVTYYALARDEAGNESLTDTYAFTVE
ncbi:MAG: sigma-70 family RNA polymerase sigma factor [Anaerolineales bacterium]|nr:sigma-70 family RNA polymerase sigma factor [Anaerolineales bacterium]